MNIHNEDGELRIRPYVLCKRTLTPRKPWLLAMPVVLAPYLSATGERRSALVTLGWLAAGLVLMVWVAHGGNNP